MGRPLGLAAQQDGAPDTRRGGAHQRHAGGSGPHLGVCDIIVIVVLTMCNLTISSILLNPN